MCKVDGGTFVMGTAERNLPDRKIPVFQFETPAHKVSVSPYYIDQLEVSVAQVAFWLNARGDNKCDNADGKCVYLAPSASSPISLTGSAFTLEQDKANLPFELFSFEGAKAYCEWVKKRLPTEAEWEFAARHDPKTGKDLVYPWGDKLDAKRTNCKESSCADGFNMLAPVGTFHGENGFLNDASPWGVHDMAGNAPELVADCWAEHYTPCKGVCDNPNKEAQACAVHTLRLASWTSNDKTARATSRQDATVPGGVRCARDVP